MSGMVYVDATTLEVMRKVRKGSGEEACNSYIAVDEYGRWGYHIGYAPLNGLAKHIDVVTGCPPNEKLAVLAKGKTLLDEVRGMRKAMDGFAVVFRDTGWQLPLGPDLDKLLEKVEKALEESA